MEVIRDSDVVSGFRFEHPIEGFHPLTHCGEADCCANHFIKPHRHTVFEFTYILRGHLSVQVEGYGTFHMDATDLFIAWPDELHGWADRKHGGFRQFWFGIDLDRLSGRAQGLANALRKSDLHLLRACSEAEPLMRSLVRQVIRKMPHQREVVEAQLSALVEIIHQRLLTGDSNPPAFFSYPLEKAMCFMMSHLDNRFILHEVAAISGYDPAVFSRLFKRAIGLSPGAWHLEARLKAAKEALLGIDTSIIEIAHRYGFSSSQHFSQAFRHAFDVSPGRWRATANQLPRAASNSRTGQNDKYTSSRRDITQSRTELTKTSAASETPGLRRTR